MKTLPKMLVHGAVCVALLLSVTPLHGGSIEKGKYQGIEVLQFEIAEGVEFPVDYLVTLTEEVVAQLEKKNKFKHVLRHKGRSSEELSTIQLTGVITEFKAGNRAKRYLIGFGAGKTKIVAKIRFWDRSTGELLLEKKADGKVIMGVIGGDSVGATRGLAKEIAKVAEKKFF